MTREVEYPALQRLYESSSGPLWNRRDGWLTSYACEGVAPFYPTPSWYGVSACSFGSVSRLVLNANRLQGTLPQQIGVLTSISYALHLQSNVLSGTLPTEFGALQSLRDLRIQSNRLSGTIPTEFGLMTQLQELHLELNSISGTLPTQLRNLTRLQTLCASSPALAQPSPCILAHALHASCP